MIVPDLVRGEGCRDAATVDGSLSPGSLEIISNSAVLLGRIAIVRCDISSISCSAGIGKGNRPKAAGNRTGLEPLDMTVAQQVICTVSMSGGVNNITSVWIGRFGEHSIAILASGITISHVARDIPAVTIKSVVCIETIKIGRAHV